MTVKNILANISSLSDRDKEYILGFLFIGLVLIPLQQENGKRFGKR